jgi:hypothetical protein
MTYEDFVRMALALPDVAEGTSYGTPALKVHGKFMARLREEDVLVLKPVDELEKRMLLESAPDTYYITDHYDGYPTILIRLSRVDSGELRGLLEAAWRQLAPKQVVAAWEERCSAG